jgi:hypothetical protein
LACDSLSPAKAKEYGSMAMAPNRPNPNIAKNSGKKKLDILLILYNLTLE